MTCQPARTRAINSSGSRFHAMLHAFTFNLNEIQLLKPLDSRYQLLNTLHVPSMMFVVRSFPDRKPLEWFTI